MSAYYGGTGISTFPSQSSAYRSYLLPNDKLSLSRPSRTVPSRVIPAKTYKTLYTRRDRGQTAEPYFFDPRRYRSGSGPWKDTRNWPMYWKKRKFTQPIQTYQESEFGGNPIDRIPHNYFGYYTTPSDMQHTVMRRVRPYYAPSYITYPPSIMNPNRSSKVVDEKYPLIMRVIIKIIELMLGASTTAFVLAPIRDLSFFEFVKITQTEWQGIVVGVGVTFSVLCIILLTTASLAQRSSLWRRFDGMISLGGTICYFLAGGIEAYYAACYPPRGAIIGLVCYRFEWIFASVSYSDLVSK
ncbi:unnamed protein product [Thelazia callipaeda]|uniref:MARVEL domain-containing protein n=1 Tax=Thelazia callipaeda TaxID=103827 RepID=A0A0N5DB06_THECL|nr:unnamed protein product [Thelazia callipaeda]